MSDVHTKKQRSYNMSRIRASDTRPEVMLRRELKIFGVRAYSRKSKISGKPDLYFKDSKVAVFVDGCFWHKCPKCFKRPKSNRVFWDKKINSNVKRDKRVTADLQAKGITVIRFWEHDIYRNLTRVTKEIIDHF